NIITLQNLGESPYKRHFLDINGNTGAVILERCIGSGIDWRINHKGNNIVTLQNQGKSSYKNYFLDIDGNTGAVILSPQEYSGTHWIMT
ncbi:TPA: hypothetical protein ROY01_006161, partial [Bacillus toyonensis]|nr:hypothetical protein [Bacillus toyonensis]